MVTALGKLPAHTEKKEQQQIHEEKIIIIAMIPELCVYVREYNIMCVRKFNTLHL